MAAVLTGAVEPRRALHPARLPARAARSTSSSGWWRSPRPRSRRRGSPGRPLVRGERAFIGVMSLGIGAILLLIPSTGSVLNQVINGGAQTLLPSAEVAYPWLLALLATSIFSGLGIARRTLGSRASRRTRLARGIGLGVAATFVVGSTFTGVAVANDLALRDRPAASSPFGPTDPNRQPPDCSAPIETGTTALLSVQMTANVDGRPVGQIAISGERSGTDLRWTADVATDRTLGRFGVARVGRPGLAPEPGRLVDGREPEPGRGPTSSTGQALDSRPLRRPPGDGREPRPRVHRGSPGTALPDRGRRGDVHRGVPRGRLVRGRRPRSATGEASSTSGSSRTARSARSRARSAARPEPLGRERDRGYDRRDARRDRTRPVPVDQSRRPAEGSSDQGR